MACSHHILFIHLLMDLGFVYLLAIVSNAVVNSSVQVSGGVPVLNYFGYTSKSGISELNGNSMVTITFSGTLNNKVFPIVAMPN